MAHTVQAWGVFRDGHLVSGVAGQPEADAKKQAGALNKFNGEHATYVPQEIRGKRVVIEDEPKEEKT